VPPLEFGSYRLRASASMTVLALAGVALFISLGRWQWQRAEEKRVQAAAFAAGSADAGSPLGGRSIPSLARYTQVRVHGQYDAARQFLLDNMSHGGRAGYQALTPFRLDDGRVLLVNRGWLPLPGGRRDTLPDIAVPGAAPIEIVGRLDDLPAAGLKAGVAPPSLDAQWPKRTSFPDAAALGAALGEPVEARQLLLSSGEPYGYVRDWRSAAAGFGPERHISYAVQWWGFAALSLFLYLYLNIERRSP
jgi:surfeit locus 1 family protein